MAKTTPYASHEISRKAPGYYQALAQTNTKNQKAAPPMSSDHKPRQSAPAATDTLSDWRRKSLAATPSQYPSEHRREKRRQEKLEVRLQKQGKTLGATRTFDLNSRGMGVDCNELELHTGEVVEIDLPESDIPEDMESHAFCLVVYAGEHCGLMYLDQNKKPPRK